MTTQDQFEERARKLIAAIPAIGHWLGGRLTETMVHIFSTALRDQDRASRNAALEEVAGMVLVPRETKPTALETYVSMKAHESRIAAYKELIAAYEGG